MAYKFSSLILLLLASLSFSAKIENLFGDLYTKDVYGGYLKTDVEGNELYYLFFPSQSNEPLKDPVLLWLNGGPGCSSMSGMFTENGPVVTDLYSRKMHTNKHSWNNHANVLYIDSPAGVGFSKSADLKQPFNDEKTAKGLVAALKNFFAEFTDYANNEFYISIRSDTTNEEKINKFEEMIVDYNLCDNDYEIARNICLSIVPPYQLIIDLCKKQLGEN